MARKLARRGARHRGARDSAGGGVEGGLLLAASLTASAQMPRAEDRHDEQRHSHGGEDATRAEDALGCGAQHVAAQSDADRLLRAFAVLAFAATGVALFGHISEVAGLALAVWSVVALVRDGLGRRRP